MTKENEKKKKSIGKVVLAAGVAGIIALSGSTLSITKVDAFEYGKAPIQTNQQSVNVYYNGKQVEFSDQKPVMENDRVKVPFRKVFEDMGCIVYYNNTENKIMALTKEGDILTHTIGTNEFDMNGEVKTFDSSSTIINDRTLIPLRAVAETLNSKVEWDDKNQTVTIEKEERQLDSTEKEVMMHVLDVNYNPKDTKRYVSYKKQNSDLTVEQAIINVNMDLDKEYILITENKTSGYITFNGFSHYEANPDDVEMATNLDSMTALVNGYNTIPSDYEPKDLKEYKFKESMGIEPKSLREEATNQFSRMANDYVNETGNDIHDLFIYDGYKDYNEALATINNYRFKGINRLPQDKLEKYAFDYSIRPEASEFRTGLSIGLICSTNLLYEYIEKNYRPLTEKEREYYNNQKEFQEKFERMYAWLKTNAYKYGFIERYPENKEYITRMEYQPYTYRYVGDAAETIYNQNLCLEEYYAKYLNPIVYDEAYSIEPESSQKVLSKY